MKRNTTRRAFLASTTATLAALAGCTTNNDDSTDTETPTETPTDTPTPTETTTERPTETDQEWVPVDFGNDGAPPYLEGMTIRREHGDIGGRMQFDAPDAGEIQPEYLRIAWGFDSWGNKERAYPYESWELNGDTEVEFWLDDVPERYEIHYFDSVGKVFTLDFDVTLNDYDTYWNTRHTYPESIRQSSEPSVTEGEYDVAWIDGADGSWSREPYPDACPALDYQVTAGGSVRLSPLLDRESLTGNTLVFQSWDTDGDIVGEEVYDVAEIEFDSSRDEPVVTDAYPVPGSIAVACGSGPVSDGQDVLDGFNDEWVVVIGFNEYGGVNRVSVFR